MFTQAFFILIKSEWRTVKRIYFSEGEFLNWRLVSGWPFFFSPDHVLIPIKPVPLYLALSPGSFRGDLFHGDNIEISMRKKKTNIFVAKMRNPWSNIGIAPNLWPLLINIVCLFV